MNYYIYCIIQILSLNFNLEYKIIIPEPKSVVVLAATPSISHSLVPVTQDSTEVIQYHHFEGIEALIADMEGYRSKPVYCGGWAVGYGRAIPKSKVQYYKDNPVSREAAYKMLKADLDKKRRQVEQFFWERYVELTPNQLDALASIAYNTGFYRFIQKDIVTKILSTKDPNSLTEEDFLDTIVPYQRKRMKGLLKRRRLEYQYYSK